MSHIRDRLPQNPNLSPGSEVGQITLSKAQLLPGAAALRNAPAYASLPLIEMSTLSLLDSNYVIIDACASRFPPMAIPLLRIG
jgi:hypothetical protein